MKNGSRPVEFGTRFSENCSKLLRDIFKFYLKYYKKNFFLC